MGCLLVEEEEVIVLLLIITDDRDVLEEEEELLLLFITRVRFNGIRFFRYVSLKMLCSGLVVVTVGFGILLLSRPVIPVARLELVFTVVVLGLEAEYGNTLDVFSPPSDADTSPNPPTLAGPGTVTCPAARELNVLWRSVGA